MPRKVSKQTAFLAIADAQQRVGRYVADKIISGEEPVDQYVEQQVKFIKDMYDNILSEVEVGQIFTT